MAFSRKEHLNEHSRIHNNDKPFECKICCQTFRRSCDLVRRTRLHTGERPYGCSYCPMRFSASGDVYKHARRKHSNIVNTSEQSEQVSEAGTGSSPNCLT